MANTLVKTGIFEKGTSNRAEANENGNEGGEARILKQGFPVPTDIIGFITGKKGANITNIEKATGAKLSVSDRKGPKSFNRDWYYIQLSGTGNQVDRAKKLLIINIQEATNRGGASGQQ